MIDDPLHNPCVRHGDTSGGNRKFVLEVAKVREPFGVCNTCWEYYNAVQAWKAKQPAKAELTGAERARRGRS